jgi:hypothetical protein
MTEQSVSGYIILNRSYEMADKIGLTIKPSERIGKKIDAYFQGNYLCSIGRTGYWDYHYYLKYYGKRCANKERKIYILKHKLEIETDIKKWIAFMLLWA